MPSRLSTTKGQSLKGSMSIIAWWILLLAGLQLQAPQNRATAAQDRGSVEGRVIRAGAADLLSSGIPGAQLDLGGGLTAMSGGTGNFIFHNVPPGHYTLVVERDGFVLQED